jgi:putative sigma-54 modulation protein
MKFTFTEKKMDSSDLLRAYAEKKVSKLDRYFKREVEAQVTFSIERGRYRAEITIRDGGFFYRASELTQDMYASVDSAVAAIERQLRRNKTRLEKRLREGALDQRDAVPEFAASAAEEEEDGTYEVVRTKHFAYQTMSVDEAILQMNLLDHTFFVFRNADDDGLVSVVYRREQGGYGLIIDAGK